MVRIKNISIILLLMTTILFSCEKDIVEKVDDENFTTVTTLSVESVDLTTATIRGNVKTNNFETVVTFEYGETTSYGNIINANPGTINNDTETNVNAELIGLTENMTYHYRLKAVNTSGTFYGEDVDFTTNEEGNVNTQDKQAIIDLYNNQFLTSYVYGVDWTGNTSNCEAGTISSEALAKTLQRINYYRTMVGIPDVEYFDDELNAKCQQGALMMLANNALNHNPPTSWSCYTTEGADAAGHSNIATNTASASIDLYMLDFGSGNYSAGHRRWILKPSTKSMGHGSASSYSMLWVFGGVELETPANIPEFIAWPVKGYMPQNLIPDRWSFSIKNADFSNTNISMTDESGDNIPLSIETIVNGYGENTIVWVPEVPYNYWSIDETTVNVKLENVNTEGENKDYEYSVIAILIP